MSDEARQRYLIQVERPGERLDMAAVRQLLEETDIELDPEYGPILVNPKAGRYVVRGSITDEGRRRAEQIPGVTLFTDSVIGPTEC